MKLNVKIKGTTKKSLSVGRIYQLMKDNPKAEIAILDSEKISHLIPNDLDQEIKEHNKNL